MLRGRGGFNARRDRLVKERERLARQRSQNSPTTNNREGFKPSEPRKPLQPWQEGEPDDEKLWDGRITQDSLKPQANTDIPSTNTFSIRGTTSRPPQHSDEKVRNPLSVDQPFDESQRLVDAEEAQEQDPVFQFGQLVQTAIQFIRASQPAEIVNGALDTFRVDKV
ncbi:hypothetical protein LTS18_009886, partial [Coniosporium uncinatum]